MADDYGLADLMNDLKAASVSAGRDVDAVLKRAGVNIKKDWRAAATGLQHAPAYPYSITFDMKGDSVEVGPDKQKAQGALGNLIEYGSVNNAPHNHGKTALENEIPRFQRALLEALYARMKG